MEPVQLTLNDTTPEEVLARLPEAHVVTAHVSGERGPVAILLNDVDEEEARRLATDAGFSVD